MKLQKFEDVTDDIVVEILSRLPVRAVYQCKVVSKRWLSLISRPSFEKHYRNLHDSKDNIFLLTSIIGVSPMDGVFQGDQVIEPNQSTIGNNKVAHFSWDCSENQTLKLRNILFVSSDLVLMTIVGNADYTLVMYNPLTKQSSSLPWPPHPYDESTGVRNFEGCLRSKDDPTLYMVVLVQPREDEQSNNDGQSDWFLDLFVYSSHDGEWSKFSILVPPNIEFREMHWETRSQYATVCNEKLYWARDTVIIGYDPFNKPNECEFINFPDNSGIKEEYGSITNVQRCIRLYDWRMPSASTMSFWDLTDYSNRVWSRKWVDLSDIHWRRIISSMVQPISLCIKGFNPFHGDVAYVLLSRHLLLAVNLQSKTDEQTDVDFKISSVRIITDFKIGEGSVSRFFPLVPPAWPTPFGVQMRQGVHKLELGRKKKHVRLYFL